MFFDARLCMLKRLRKILPRRMRNSKIWDKPSAESQKRLAFDQQLVWQQSRQKKIPSPRQLKYISSFFSVRERLTIVISILAVIISLGTGVIFAYAQFVEPVPEKGGSYREALVGSPLYINPILAGTNDVDLDLTKLIFAGLLRYDKNLELQPDLAESWEISEDGTVYTVKLKENIFWHDGEPVTANDVLFTFRATQEPTVNSPLLLSLQDVKVEKNDERTVTFTLTQPFTPFASILTTGIIPSHIWSSIPVNSIRLAERNIKPVGSGAWQFSRLEKDKQGTIHSYTLVPFEKHHGDLPYIEEITLRFYPDFASAIEALNSQKVDAVSFIPRQSIDSITNTQNFNTHQLQLPQYTSIFLNQGENELLKAVGIRQALAYSIDRERMIEEIFSSQTRTANGPVLPGMPGFDPEFEAYNYNPVQAQQILAEQGWEQITAEQYIEFETERLTEESEGDDDTDSDSPDEEEVNTDEDTDKEAIQPEAIAIDTGNQAVFRKKGDQILKISLTTVDQSENVRAAEMIKNAWQAIGFQVKLEIVPATILVNDILTAGNYEALLYSHILNAFPDLYTFWHSSQTDYPGLNLAGLADKDADELLEKLRQVNDRDEQARLNREFEQLLKEELPAIFLYSPKYTYLLPVKIKGFKVDRINVPADRWNNITGWYIKTDNKFKW